MGLIYALTNVVIPVCLLSYRSLNRFRLDQCIPYGQWASMVFIVYLFNWINSLFADSYFVLFIDFVLKLAIPFIPDSYTHQIEQTIINFHLEIWLDQLRCWLIGGLYLYYWKLTEYLLSKMQTQQSTQFKEGLLLKLKGQNDGQNQKFVFKPVKHFVNAAVNCDKVSEEIAENISQTARKLEEYSKKIVQEKSFHNQTFGQIKPTRQTSDQVQQQSVKKQALPQFTYKKKDLQQKMVRELPNLGLKLQASQQQIDLSDNDEEQVLRPQVISPINRKQVQNHVVFKAVPRKGNDTGGKTSTKRSDPKVEGIASQLKRTYTFTEYTSSEISSRPQIVARTYREDGDPLTEDLINKLDLSSSEYSDMFDEEDEEDLRVLECKVEVILQIGTGPSARLEIYNLELYSNSDLRIVSLYDRQFQTHKLKSIRSLPNNYFELLFDDNTKIQSRRCKFRGQHQQFMKYLQN